MNVGPAFSFAILDVVSSRTRHYANVRSLEQHDILNWTVRLANKPSDHATLVFPQVLL